MFQEVESMCLEGASLISCNKKEYSLPRESKRCEKHFNGRE